MPRSCVAFQASDKRGGEEYFVVLRVFRGRSFVMREILTLSQVSVANLICSDQLIITKGAQRFHSIRWIPRDLHLLTQSTLVLTLSIYQLL